MNDRPPPLPWPKPWRLGALLCLSCLVLGADQASALPPVQIDSLPGVRLVQAVKPGEQSGSEQQAQQKQPAPFANFDDLLEDTQSNLDELLSATAIVAEQRKQIEVLKRETERLAGELEQANTRRTELESSRKVAEGRIAELSNAIDVAVGETVRLDEELAGVRRQNAELEQRLARDETARETAQVEAEKTRTELQTKLEAATDAAEQSTAELAELRKELKRTGQELAATGRMRQQVAARAREMEQALRSSGAEAERVKAELQETKQQLGQVKAELAEMKQQLGQAASAAVDAERAREAASSEADQLRGEAERVKAELAEMKQQLRQVASAAVEAERAREAASSEADQLRGEAERAREELAAAKGEIETAHQKLTVMNGKIKELHASLDGAGPVQTTPAGGPQAKPASVAQEPLSSAVTQPSVPRRAAQNATGQPTANAPELPVGPDAATTETGSGLAAFHASVQVLNELERGETGIDLFSGVKVMGGRAVHINATPAWDTLPPVAKQTYLDTLLDDWVAAQGEHGPVVVRIVDPSGRVLLEKSGAKQHVAGD